MRKFIGGMVGFVMTLAVVVLAARWGVIEGQQFVSALWVPAGILIF